MKRSAASTALAVLQAFWGALVQFSNKGGFVLSSHIAMSLMLALFPFLLFVVSVASLSSRDIATDDLIHLMFDAWPPQVADPLADEIRTVLDNRSTGLITFGGLLTLYFASNGIDAVREAMARAYHTVDDRPFWLTRLIAVAFVVAGSVVVLFSLAVGVIIPLMAQVLGQALPEALRPWVNAEALTLAVGLVTTVFAVAACHMWLPAGRRPLARVWPGIVLTIGLWVLAVRLFSLYMAYFASYSATYAGLAGAMAALIFLYLIGSILILGAEFNSLLIDRGLI